MIEVINKGMPQYVVYDKKKKKWKFDFSKFDKESYIDNMIYDIKRQIRYDIANEQTIIYDGIEFDARQKYFDRYIQKIVLHNNGIINFPITISSINDEKYEFKTFDEFKIFIKQINDLYDHLYEIGDVIKYGGNVQGVDISPLSDYSPLELIMMEYQEAYQQIKELYFQ
jgi:hypothetical protein